MVMKAMCCHTNAGSFFVALCAFTVTDEPGTVGDLQLGPVFHQIPLGCCDTVTQQHQCHLVAKYGRCIKSAWSLHVMLPSCHSVQVWFGEE